MGRLRNGTDFAEAVVVSGAPSFGLSVVARAVFVAVVIAVPLLALGLVRARTVMLLSSDTSRPMIPRPPRHRSRPPVED